MKQVYALIWKATEADAAFRQEEFDARIPRLMEWLRGLESRGKLVACGGGGFSDRAGGLSLVLADRPDEAERLGAGQPMNEIGKTEIFLWDVFYADLVELTHQEKLR